MKRREEVTESGRSPAALLILINILISVLGACSDSPTAPLSGVPAEIVMDLTQLQVQSLQETFQIGVRVLDESGQEIQGVPLEWSIEGGGVLEAMGNSTFRSLANGEALVQVTLAGDHPSVDTGGYRSGRLHATAQVKVKQVPVALGFTPGHGSSGLKSEVWLWALGQKTDLYIWTVDAMGQPVEPVAWATQWNTSDGTVGGVSSGGQVTARGHGSTLVHAASLGLQGSVAIRVDAVLNLSACATISTGDGGGGAGVEEVCGEGSLTFVEEGY